VVYSIRTKKQIQEMHWKCQVELKIVRYLCQPPANDAHIKGNQAKRVAIEPDIWFD
jgi:hypothetical protein